MRRSLLLPNLRLTSQILNDHRAQFHLARFRLLSRRRTHGRARRRSARVNRSAADHNTGASNPAADTSIFLMSQA